MHTFDPRPFAPLPGTVRAPRAFFVDRWGTVLEAPEEGFARRPEEVRFLPGALEWLFRASRAGWGLYFLGNEEAVWSGRLALETWERVEDAFLEALSAAGVAVGRSYACVDHPEGVPGRRSDSVYLLPNTGAFYHAHHNDGVDLERSWVIGDSTVELAAGWRSGCRQAGVRTGAGLRDGTFQVDPELVGDDLADVLRNLLSLEDARHAG